MRQLMIYPEGNVKTDSDAREVDNRDPQTIISEQRDVIAALRKDNQRLRDQLAASGKGLDELRAHLWQTYERLSDVHGHLEDARGKLSEARLLVDGVEP
jgi:hypothetical protein